jgi:hypothetical protein
LEITAPLKEAKQKVSYLFGAFPALALTPTLSCPWKVTRVEERIKKMDKQIAKLVKDGTREV